jgi:predicted TPR repeat methyltransferase
MTKFLADAAYRFHSSGDFLTDWRLSYAEDLIREGDCDAAADLLMQALERTPDWPIAWFKLAEVEEELGHVAAATAAYQRALALDPEDELGAALHLARLGAAEAPEQAPEAYVRALFDQYAGRFDSHLVCRLGYRGPALLHSSILRLDEQHFDHVIDLGCGTGLSGAPFRSMADRLTGVDLSPGMIAAARAKNLYDRLEVANIQDFLSSEPPSSADLVVAGDVLCYVGDLAPLMKAARDVLEPDGLLAATLQKGEDVFELGADLRFSHASSYVREIAGASEFSVAIMDEAASRHDAGAEVAGLVVVLRRDA